jgi:lysophospholipase L1-like esterase
LSHWRGRYQNPKQLRLYAKAKLKLSSSPRTVDVSSRKLLAYQLGAAALTLILLEAVARLAVTLSVGPLYAGAHSTPQPWFVYTDDVGWERRPDFTGPDDCQAGREFDARGFLKADAAKLRNTTPGGRRVLFLGDSNTYGYCLDNTATFVEVADRLLPQYDLINLGVPGHTSYQGYKQLLKFEAMIKPDIIVISYNFNDRRYVTNPNDADSDAVFHKLRSAHELQLLEYSYLYRAVRAVGKKLGLIRASPPPATVRVDRLEPRVDPARYRDNLIKMIEWARQNGSTPYLLLLGDNPNQTELLRRGIDHLERRDYQAAIQDLSPITLHSRYAFATLARKYLSRAFAELGDPTRAEQVLTIAPQQTVHGGAPVFLDEVYNQIMREVASAYTVTLIDGKSVLNKNARVFFDSCHFDAEGHEMIGKLIKDVLASSN